LLNTVHAGNITHTVGDYPTMKARPDAIAANPFTFRARLNPPPAAVARAQTQRPPERAAPRVQSPSEQFEGRLRRSENVTVGLGLTGVASFAGAMVAALAGGPVLPFVIVGAALFTAAVGTVATK
jgi:hypothetical protein